MWLDAAESINHCLLCAESKGKLSLFFLPEIPNVEKEGIIIYCTILGVRVLDEELTDNEDFGVDGEDTAATAIIAAPNFDCIVNPCWFCGRRRHSLITCCSFLQ